MLSSLNLKLQGFNPAVSDMVQGFWFETVHCSARNKVQNEVYSDAFWSDNTGHILIANDLQQTGSGWTFGNVLFDSNRIQVTWRMMFSSSTPVKVAQSKLLAPLLKECLWVPVSMDDIEVREFLAKEFSSFYKIDLDDLEIDFADAHPGEY